MGNNWMDWRRGHGLALCLRSWRKRLLGLSPTDWELPRGDAKRKNGLQPGLKLMLTGCMASKKLLLQASVYTSASNIPFQGYQEAGMRNPVCEDLMNSQALYPLVSKRSVGKSQEGFLEECERS